MSDMMAIICGYCGCKVYKAIIDGEEKFVDIVGLSSQGIYQQGKRIIKHTCRSYDMKGGN